LFVAGEREGNFLRTRATDGRRERPVPLQEITNKTRRASLFNLWSLILRVLKNEIGVTISDETLNLFTSKCDQTGAKVCRPQYWRIFAAGFCLVWEPGKVAASRAFVFIYWGFSRGTLEQHAIRIFY